MQEPVIVEIGWRQMAAAYIYVIIPFILLRRRRINKQWELVLASMRMTGQLVLAGYVLTYIFGRPHVAVTLLVFAGMEWFAVRNIYARIGRELSGRLRKVKPFRCSSAVQPASCSSCWLSSDSIRGILPLTLSPLGE